MQTVGRGDLKSFDLVFILGDGLRISYGYALMLNMCLTVIRIMNCDEQCKD